MKYLREVYYLIGITGLFHLMAKYGDNNVITMLISSIASILIFLAYSLKEAKDKNKELLKAYNELLLEVGIAKSGYLQMVSSSKEVTSALEVIKNISKLSPVELNNLKNQQKGNNSSVKQEPMFIGSKK